MERSFVLAGVVPARPVDFLDEFEDYERRREAGSGLASGNRDLLSLVTDRIVRGTTRPGR